MADFTNIDGVYAKDTELRSGIDTLRTTVLSNTIKPLTVNNDGTYTANPAEGVYGYSPVTVSVNSPWEPLEDGYSNFWFELTNDTLSPWLNFSAKNSDAVIDWGDGSGEQILNTLHPTHTYSKAGKYVVKVKGVLGIAAQHNIPYNALYFSVLKYVELNNSVKELANAAFAREVMLQKVKLPSTITTVGTTAFTLCTSLKEPPFYDGITAIPASYLSFAMSLKDVVLPNTITSVGASTFYYAQGLNSITFPASCTDIGSTVFAQCYSLETIRVKATTPPTLGNNVFQSIAPNYIIYVPAGYGDTYKSAAGWSAYANHILEEGQTPNRMMLAKFKEETDEPQDDMR